MLEGGRFEGARLEGCWRWHVGGENVEMPV